MEEQVTAATAVQATAVQATAVQATAVQATAAAPIEAAAPAPSIESQFNNLLQDLTCFKTYLSDIQSKVRLLEKTVTKELKNELKQLHKQEKKKATTKIQLPLGFNKPSLISNELALFMGKPLNTLLARTEVTKIITAYIRDNKLQDMTHRERIMPNEALRVLLHFQTQPIEPLTYFNLQKYLSVHFIKS